MKYSSFVISLLVICSFILLAQAYPDCSAINNIDGEHFVNSKLYFYGLIYPNSFGINLYPGKECYYIANNYMKLAYSSSDIKGTIYEYGFDGWDGQHIDTCSYTREYQIDTSSHYTAWSSGILRSKNVCSNVVRIKNTSKIS